jgi:hypothetical protein
MGKKIQIGNSEGILLNENEKEVKTKIIDYLYSTLNLSNLRYGMLDNISKLKFLQDNEHYVTPNYKGISYFLIFTKLFDKNYAILINRKKLSYHRNQVDMKTIFIVKILVNTTDKLYLGTIFDGKIVQKDNKHYFLIQDCFCMFSKKILNMEMNSKISYLNEIITLNLKETSCENFNFKLNKLYKYDDLKDVISNIIPNCGIISNGLVFYPPISGNCIIHIEQKVNKVEIQNSLIENIEDNSLDFISNFTEIMKKREYSYEKENKKKILYMSKTEIPDVYYLYSNSQNNDNDNKIGIAHIPNLKISHYCLENITKPLTRVECVYYSKFEKWIPLNLV